MSTFPVMALISFILRGFIIDHLKQPKQMALYLAYFPQLLSVRVIKEHKLSASSLNVTPCKLSLLACIAPQLEISVIAVMHNHQPESGRLWQVIHHS
jgi:hypothetical protein